MLWPSAIWSLWALHIGLLSLLVPLSRLSCYHQQNHTHAHSHTHTHTYWHVCWCLSCVTFRSEKIEQIHFDQECTLKQIFIVMLFVIYPNVSVCVSVCVRASHAHTHTHTHKQTDRESGQCADLSKPFLNVYCSVQRREEGAPSVFCTYQPLSLFCSLHDCLFYWHNKKHCEILQNTPFNIWNIWIHLEKSLKMASLAPSSFM